MLLKNSKKIKIDMQALAKKILDEGVPLNVFPTQMYVDKTGNGAYVCKEILEKAIHDATAKLGDHYIITQAEMATVCEHIILYLTVEAERRLQRIVRLGFTQEYRDIVAEGEQEYEVEDEKEFEAQVS